MRRSSVVVASRCPGCATGIGWLVSTRRRRSTLAASGWAVMGVVLLLVGGWAGRLKPRLGGLRATKPASAG